MTSAVVGMCHSAYMLLPILFEVCIERSQHIQECVVETLSEAVTLRVVRGRPRLLDAAYFTQFSYEMSFKVTALVGMNSNRETVVGYEVLPDDFCDCGGLLISCRIGLCVFGEMIGDY